MKPSRPGRRCGLGHLRRYACRCARSSEERGRVTGEENKRVYERYIGLLNAQDFGSLNEVVDPERYREICVGFTPGWVDLRGGCLTRKGSRRHSRPERPYRRHGRRGRQGVRAPDGDGHELGALLRGSPHRALLRGEHVRLREDRERQDRRAHPASDTLSQLTQMYGGAAKKAGSAAGAGLLGAALLVLGRGR